MGFESTSDMETKEFCGAAWPSKVLKGKRGNPYCPLNAPDNFWGQNGRLREAYMASLVLRFVTIQQFLDSYLYLCFFFECHRDFF
jgi:hypothetical protein